MTNTSAAENLASTSAKSAKKYGVLAVNLGTPDKPDTASVRRYLKQFLSDSRVIDYPRWLWAIILNCIILPIRAPKVAKLYAKIWLPEDSPLRVYTNAIANGMQTHLNQQLDADVVVEMAMTYGSPSMDEALKKLTAQGIERIVILPLYPQYSATTTAAVFDCLNASLAKVRNLPSTRFIKNYSHEGSYIKALSATISAHRAKRTTKADILLFSFHGLPKRYITLGDPYQAECLQTAKDVAAILGLTDDEYFVSYQSRVGKEEWVKPYTDATLAEFPAKGIKNIDVICPAFATDCLETLEEIAMENKEIFIEAGGEDYQYIPALNADDEHIDVLSELVARQIKAWV